MSLVGPTLRLIVYEGPGAQPLGADRRYQTVRTLLERGFAVTQSGSARPVSPPDRAPVVVLGDFDSAVDFAPDPNIRFRDLRNIDETQLCELIETERTETATARHGEWKPWFPVIDYDRCTNCMQCLSFCLFGVYGVDGEKRIQVQNEDNCKTNCPACSRVCPEAAIMFPKYKAGPINGDVVSDADLQKEKMKVDISALLGGDVYAMLRLRSEKARSRFSKERDSDKALSERQKCLVKLAQAGDIPPEVLMSLPSPEEIARRAEEAAARAQAALKP